jgi:hypothetical protein
MFMHNGKPLGGNSAFAHFGTCEERCGEIIGEVSRVITTILQRSRGLQRADSRMTVTSNGRHQAWRILNAAYQDDMLLDLEKQDLHAIAYD